MTEISENEQAKDKPKKTKKKVDSVLRKTAARVAAVKLLYEYELNPPENGDLNSLVKSALNDEIEIMSQSKSGDSDKLYRNKIVPDALMLKEITEGVINYSDKIDDMYSSFLADGWDVKRLTTLVRVILRAAVYEMLFVKKNPYKIVIQEYLKVSDAFCEESETAFINAVLDKAKNTI